METFKDRLYLEFNDLEDKIGKLESFVNSKILFEIPNIQKVLLCVQLDAMKTYATCLNERIDNLK